jgi:hypothetical protein
MILGSRYKIQEASIKKNVEERKKWKGYSTKERGVSIRSSFYNYKYEMFIKSRANQSSTSVVSLPIFIQTLKQIIPNHIRDDPVNPLTNLKRMIVAQVARVKFQYVLPNLCFLLFLGLTSFPPFFSDQGSKLP